MCLFICPRHLSPRSQEPAIAPGQNKLNSIQLWHVGWTWLWKWVHMQILFLFSQHAAIMMMEKQEPSFSATYAETCVLTVIGFCIYIAVLTYTRDRWEILLSFFDFSKHHRVMWVCPIHWFDKEFAGALLISPLQITFWLTLWTNTVGFLSLLYHLMFQILRNG